MLKQVQHDITVRFWSFCHPEPGPEHVSGSTISGSDLGFGFKNLGFKAPPCGRGSLFPALIQEGRSPCGQNGPIFFCHMGLCPDQSFIYLRNLPMHT